MENQLSQADAAWVHRHVPVTWYERYGPRAEAMRLPKEASTRDALAVQIGAEGYALMDELFSQDDARHLRQLPALEMHRQRWLQQYDRCTEPGMEAVRWRGSDERPQRSTTNKTALMPKNASCKRWVTPGIQYERGYNVFAHRIPT